MVTVFNILYLCSFLLTLVSLLPSIGIILPLDFGMYNKLLTIALLPAPSYLIGYAVQAITGQYGGEVWGHKILVPQRIRRFRIIGIIGGVFGAAVYLLFFRGLIGGFVQDILNLIIGLIKIVFTGRFVEYLLNAVYFLMKVAAIVLPLSLGLSLATKVGLKLYPFTKDLENLGRVSIFQSVEEHIDTTKQLYIDGERIILIKHSGEVLQLIYSQYGLKELHRTVTAAETKNVASFKIGLLGLYITKKYGNDFRFSIQKELVRGAAGSPGVSVIVVTPAGTYQGTVGGTPDIPDKYPFNGYLFVRKH